MTEQIVGGLWQHGDVIAEYVDGDGLLACGACSAGIYRSRWEAHQARHAREGVVTAASMLTNERGINFQPGQSWAMKQGPRGRARVGARKRAAR